MNHTLLSWRMGLLLINSFALQRWVCQIFLNSMVIGGDSLVDEIEVSENKEALIVLAGTVADAATTFIASLPLPLKIKAPVVADYASNLMNSSRSILASFIIFKSKPTPMFSLA
jgi:hypothetical protein